jgi:hypothetical protein
MSRSRTGSFTRNKLCAPSHHPIKSMKKIFFLLIFFSGVGALQADLIMELNFISPKLKLVVKIKEDKIRYDLLPDGGYGNTSRIVNPKTGDDFILEHVNKRITPSSATFSQTNAAAKTEWLKFLDINKTEIFHGFEAEIYKATNSDGMVETLWVAKSYPDFKKIKNDLSRLDEKSDKRFMPELSSLPGMPLQLLVPIKNSYVSGAYFTYTLLSAKEEFIDDSTFGLPKGYHYYGLQSSSLPVGLLNATMATNLNQWKAAITNFHNDPMLKENWVMQQSDTNTGVRLIISGTNQTWMEFDSNFINVNTEKNSDNIHKIEIQGEDMNIADIRFVGSVLLKVMGKGESDLNAWCDKIESSPADKSLFSSVSAYLPNGKVGRFEIISSDDPEKPWTIKFVIAEE